MYELTVNGHRVELLQELDGGVWNLWIDGEAVGDGYGDGFRTLEEAMAVVYVAIRRG